MTYMGAEGMRHVADVSLKRAHTLATRLGALPGWELAFPDRQFLNEFPIRVPNPAAANRKLARKGILGGLDMHRCFRHLKPLFPFTCPEANDPPPLDQPVEPRP